MAESWERTRLDHRGRQAASIAVSAMSLLADRGAPALTMSAIADHAGISRQTLYRYYKDVDAVLVGIAEQVTSHDEELERQVRAQPDPASQLALIAETAAGSGHGNQSTETLLALLPPAGRDIVLRHHTRSCDLLAEVLQSGIDDGSFRPDVNPDLDPPLLLGLLSTADADSSRRAVSLVAQLVHHQP